MSFASETVLKFDSSPISFAVATLLSYSMQNEKMGAFNYRRKEVISLEGLFSQKALRNRSPSILRTSKIF